MHNMTLALRSPASTRRHRRPVAFSVCLLAILASLLAGAGGARAASTVLIGDQSVEPQVDGNSPGQAEAFPFVATASGATSTADVYIDATSTASTVSVGVYTDAGGSPGTLVTDGSLSTPNASGWDTISLAPASLTAGTTYWIAILGVDGDIAFRDRDDSSCKSSTTTETTLDALPQTWDAGTDWPTCSSSVYLTADSSTTVVSAPVDTARPSISGTAAQGQTLTSSTGTWTNSPTGYAYQWQDCDASGAGCSAITGATSASYTLGGQDVGQTVVSTVTATNTGGSATASSPPTAAVAAAPISPGSAPSVPTGVSAGASTSAHADLSWSAGVSGSSAGYTIYRDGTKLATTTTTTYSDTTVSPGATYEYSIAAFDASGDTSPQTSPITVIVPQAGTKTIFADNFAGSSLNPAWTIISRHGEYAQNETECNVPQEVSVHDNMVDIATIAQNTVCGDYNLDGTARHPAAIWPYATGDIQWSNFSFTYGTVSYRAKFPAQSTGTWPAIWLLGSNCQATNIVTADTGYDSCPNLWTQAYAEVDTTECDTGNWCQLGMATPTTWPLCGYSMDSVWHTWTIGWTADQISISEDGHSTGCSFTRAEGYVIPSTPMFLIMQTQTGGSGGTPDNANLPAHLEVSDVTVTQP